MRWLLVLAALLLFAPAAAQAACTVTASGISFGSYISGTTLDTTGTLTVNCASGTAYTVALSAGMGSGATVTTRSMPMSTPAVNYSLFRDAARTANWGQTPGTDTVAGTGTGSAQTITIYARLPSQYPSPSTYTDTIVATVSDAGTATASFPVSAMVSPTCTISSSNLNFGTYVGAQLSSTATLTATCTNTTAYTIGLGAGQAPGATVTTRKMEGPQSATLAYGLYLDAGFTRNWGVTPSVDTAAGLGDGVAQPITVYGMIAAGQYVTPGAYSDIVAVTLTY